MKKNKKRGWCPTEVRPVEGVDGYLLRIIPKMGYLTSEDTIEFCNLSIKYGNGIIDLTNRGNLQMRGIEEKNISLIGRILTKKKISSYYRNLIITPFWKKDDINNIIYNKIKYSCNRLTKTPEKFSILIDAGAFPVLRNVSADIRIEKSITNKLVIFAEGYNKGKNSSLDQLTDNINYLLDFFIKNSSNKKNRMHKILKENNLPACWSQIRPKKTKLPSINSISELGTYYDSNFGRLEAASLKKLVCKSKAKEIRFTPFKTLIFCKGKKVIEKNLPLKKEQSTTNIYACTGINYCKSATINTHLLASKFKCLKGKNIHISGCTKGCAYPGKTDISLVGREGLIDIIFNGRPCDKADIKSLSDKNILKYLL